MKKSYLFLLALLMLAITNACSSKKSSSMNNMVALMQVEEPIPGVCNNDKIVAILPLPGNGQTKAKPPMTKEEIEIQLNANVPYLKQQPTDYQDKGMVNLVVNCKGQLVRCQISNKTKSPELDAAIVAVFSKLEKWEAGSIHKNPVDTSVLYSFTIENGKITL